jgi:hypothetical protein
VKAVNVYAILAGFALAQLAAAWFIHVPNARDDGRRAGYAAAVDSVRAVAWRTEPIRILDAYGASYTILTFNAAGRETSMVHVGGAK